MEGLGVKTLRSATRDLVLKASFDGITTNNELSRTCNKPGVAHFEIRSQYIRDKIKGKIICIKSSGLGIEIKSSKIQHSHI
jgi:hypothetical protein